MKKTIFFLLFSICALGAIALINCSAMKNFSNELRYELWSSSGYTTEEAAEWDAAGFDMFEGQKWRLAGFYWQGQADEAKRWKTEGFVPKTAGEWRKAGFDLVSALEWCKLEFIQATVTESGYYKEATITCSNGIEPKVAREWIDAGFTKEEAIKYSHSLRPKIASEWKNADFTIEDAINWRQNNFDIETATEWKKYQFTPQEAYNWQSVTFEIVETAITFSPDEASKYKKDGFDYEAAALLSLAKWSKKEAKDNLLRMNKECGNDIKTIQELEQLNPYDVNGKCFEVTASTFQLLDKSQSLNYIPKGDILSSKIHLLDFGRNSATANEFWGVIKGVGVYKYLALAGLQIIPKHKVIVQYMGK